MQLQLYQATRWVRYRAFRALYRFYREEAAPYRVDPYLIHELHRKFQVTGPAGPLTFMVELEPEEAPLVLYAICNAPGNLLHHMGSKRLKRLSVTVDIPKRSRCI